MKFIPRNRPLFILGFLGTSLLIFFSSSLPVSALHNAAWVDSHVQWQKASDGTAKPTVVGWENDCTATFNSNKSSGQYGSQRAVVNASAYNQTIWITRAGDPRDVNNTPVTPGSSVNMQINDILFLCSIVTMNPSGYSISASHEVTNGNYPNDRAPVPDDAQYDPNPASRYESNSKIYSATIAKGPPGGSISNNPTGKIMGYKRDTTSRYWDAPTVPFTYNVPAGLAAGTYTITVNIDYATIQTYHDYGSSGTSRCTLKNGNGADVPYGDFNICERRTEPYQFKLTVQPTGPPASARPQTTVDNPQIAFPGTATFTHSVIPVSGSLSGSNFNYLIQRYRNGVPTGGPQAGVYGYSAGGIIKTNVYNSSSADAGSTICESLTLSNVVGGTIAITGNPSQACTVIANQPYVKVFGGDVSVGGGLSTAPNVCNLNASAGVMAWNLGAGNAFAGAGSQYAVSAMNDITDFSTAQGNTGGAPAPDGLAFADNPVSAGTFGGSLGYASCISDYYSRKPAGAAATGPNLSSLSSGAYAATGLLTLNTQTVINPGNRIQVYVDGDVYIQKNILYAGAWTTDNMPLFELIVRGNIYIDAGVQQLDGAYIAQKDTSGGRGAIYTCATGPSILLPTDPAFYNICNNKLTVNGSFTADQIHLLRTTGTVANSKTDNPTTGTSSAGEQFNFNPTLWIAQPPAASTNGTYDAITSLPPVL